MLPSPPAASLHPKEITSKRHIAFRPPTPPRVAFIIDDFGNDLKAAVPILTSPFPIALSVLPYLPYSQTLAGEAKRERKPLLLHLPLEAVKDNKLLGPGALFTDMDDDTLKILIEQDLQSVPGAEGINNHMGSKASSDPRIARTVAIEAKSRHLFIVDSLTAPNSALYEEARKLGVPSAKRDVFLDDQAKESYINGQIDELVKIAKEQGEAIAIGHPHPQTLKVLLEAIPKIQKEGIQVVPVTELVNSN